MARVVPVIASVTVVDKSVRNLSFAIGVNYLVKVEGVNLYPRTLVRLTTSPDSSGELCQFENDGLSDSFGVLVHPHFVSDTLGFFTVLLINDLHEPLYLCVGDATLNSSINAHHQELIKWIHQGRNVFLLGDNHQNTPDEVSVATSSR
ncbi:hypothetical protein RUM44_000952 [Polyplax serrata]|uniref:Peptidase S26 domain-containing protein n=1 Tax=Polyplax serrata TaxID=468196 RepID=A0ABR1B928_POLSC